MFSGINFWAVLVSGVSYFILGGVWYAAIFSKQYQAALKLTPEEQAQGEKAFPMALATHFISGLITSIVLATLINAWGANSFFEGMVCSFWIWLGFAFTINLNYMMFERRPTGLFMINNGFFLIAFLVMGGILSVWR